MRAQQTSHKHQELECSLVWNLKQDIQNTGSNLNPVNTKNLVKVHIYSLRIQDREEMCNLNGLLYCSLQKMMNTVRDILGSAETVLADWLTINNYEVQHRDNYKSSLTLGTHNLTAHNTLSSENLRRKKLRGWVGVARLWQIAMGESVRGDQSFEYSSLWNERKWNSDLNYIGYIENAHPIRELMYICFKQHKVLQHKWFRRKSTPKISSEIFVEVPTSCSLFIIHFFASHSSAMLVQLCQAFV